MLRGVPLAFLLQLVAMCCNVSAGMGGVAVAQWCWPDGRVGLNQPAWLVQVFHAAKQTMMHELGKQLGGKNG